MSRHGSIDKRLHGLRIDALADLCRGSVVGVRYAPVLGDLRVDQGVDGGRVDAAVRRHRSSR